MKLAWHLSHRDMTDWRHVSQTKVSRGQSTKKHDGLHSDRCYSAVFSFWLLGRGRTAAFRWLISSGKSKMPIKKQEFYEGAALHQLSRSGGIRGLRYEPPFFILNNLLSVCLKYSTKGRSPWGFTFTPDEQSLLRNRAKRRDLIIGLICGPDGIAAISYEDYRKIAPLRNYSIPVSCYRKHGEHYGVFGPDGELERKIPPSLWQRILEK